MNKIKLWVLVLFVVLLVALYSFIPVCILYLSPSQPIYKNSEAVQRIEDKNEKLFSFAVFGDNHAGCYFLSDSVALKVIHEINRENRYRLDGAYEKLPIRFVMSTGDVTFRSRLWDYQIFNKLRGKLDWPLISARGNHDDDNNPSLTYFHKFIGESTFAFSHGNSYFIIVDNSHEDVFTLAQFAWLEQELKKSLNYRHCFVFAHKSPVSALRLSWFRPELSRWSYRFLKLLEKYKVEAMFAGHEHLYHEEMYGGVRYITTGGAGMIPTVPESEGGFTNYVVVAVYGDYVHYEVRKVTPPLWELPLFWLKDMWFKIKEII